MIRDTRMKGAGKLGLGLAALLALLLSGQLRAAEGGGGLRVFNSDIHDNKDGDKGGSPAINLIGTRNGSFSGKVAVGGGPIQGLKAKISDLKQNTAVLPSTSIRIGYGMPWDMSITGQFRPEGNDILMEVPPADVASGTVPVWITVPVPKTVAPGSYAGTLTVEAKGLGPVQVPVKLDVRDWTLPNTQDYRTWVEMLQSPDTLALEYNLPLWSDKHWEMIGQSLVYMGQVGSRVLYIPLIAQTNYGNSESMVRWIKKGENQYEFDFTNMEKYLDLAEKRMGKPKIVVLYAWDIFLKPPEKEPVIDANMKGYQKAETEKWLERWKLRDQGPPVTLLDKTTGKTDTFRPPRYEKPESRTLWKPLYTELKARLAKRGLEKTLHLGMMSDHCPNEAEVISLNEISGNLPWASCSHHYRWKHGTKAIEENVIYKVASIGYAALSLEFFYILNPAKQRAYGWKEPFTQGVYWRFGIRFGKDTLPIIRNEAEANITGLQRGIAHLGADFWPCLKNKAGKRTSVVGERYPESYWHSLNIGSYMLAPGANGPVTTARYEVFREGIQDCEARIAIESVLTDSAGKAKIGADLAQRAQALLDERHLDIWKAHGASKGKPRKQRGSPREAPSGPDYDLMDVGMISSYSQYDYEIDPEADRPGGVKWYINSGWAERSGKLYEMAQEVSTKAK